MGNSEKKCLSHELKSLRRKITKNSKLAKTIMGSIIDLKAKLNLTNDKISDGRAKAAKIETNLLFLEDFPAEFLVKRNEMLRLSRQTKRKDIAVKEVECAVAEYQKCNKVFQEEYCPHRFLIGYPGYKGSRSNDYDDAYPAYRACILCGKSEAARPEFEELSLASGNRILYEVSGRELDNTMRDMFEKLSEQPLEAIGDFYQKAINDEYWRIERKEESEPAE